MLDGNELLEEALGALQVDIAAVIARVAIWANPDTFKDLVRGSPNGTFYPNTRRCKPPEAKGQIVNGIKLDHNTYANFAIKYATGLKRGSNCNFAVCHVWDRTCYDERCHTCIANLVLIPRAVAGASDHDARTIECLKWRSFELYQWYPPNEKKPKMPNKYPQVWREPAPYVRLTPSNKLYSS